MNSTVVIPTLHFRCVSLPEGMCVLQRLDSGMCLSLPQLILNEFRSKGDSLISEQGSHLVSCLRARALTSIHKTAQ